jgi:hypothetical protein
MREDTRSPIWGGATLGLLIGLILGFFFGTYWMTVLYAVLIGAAVGLAANVLAWVGRIVAGRQHPAYGVLSDEERAHELRQAEEWLRSDRLADFGNDAMALQECVGIVGWIEEEELWRAGYDSLDSFYQAYESQHPDIRVYAAVESEIAKASDASPLDERAEVIARRLAALRHSRQPGE